MGISLREMMQEVLGGVANMDQPLVLHDTRTGQNYSVEDVDVTLQGIELNFESKEVDN